MFVHARQLASVFAEVDGVERYQAVVSHDAEHRDRLTVRVAGDPGRLDTDEIATALRDALNVRAEVDVVSPEAIGEKDGLLVDSRAWDGSDP